MWGNRLGWGLASAWLVILVGLVFMIHGLDTVSPPTAFSSSMGALQKIQMPMPARSVAPMITDTTTDAAQQYRQALSAYRAAPSKVDDFVREPAVELIAALPGIQNLLDATPSTSMNLLASDPAGVFAPGVNADLEGLRTLATACSKAGFLLAKDARHADAAKYYAAVFSLGVKLFEERVTVEELRVGLDLIDEGSKGISYVAKAAGDEDRAAAADAFRSAHRKYVDEQIAPVRDRLKTIDPGVIRRHTGDYFVLAANAPERLWRVQAVFALGQLRFNAERSGDQKGAMRKLRKMAEHEPDPIVRQAAVVARDMTLTQYHQLR